MMKKRIVRFIKFSLMMMPNITAAKTRTMSWKRMMMMMMKSRDVPRKDAILWSVYPNILMQESEHESESGSKSRPGCCWCSLGS